MNRPFQIPASHFRIEPFDIAAPDGYEAIKDFPNCCGNHRALYKRAQKWFEIFPDCCEEHKKLKAAPNFDKSNYADVADKIVLQLAFTDFLIKKVNNSENDWFDIITDYLEWNFESFGHPSAGGSHYGNVVINSIERSKEISDEKKKLLINYLKPDKSGQAAIPDFNILFDIYQNWLSAFPFHISFFEGKQANYESRFPFLSGIPKVNRYSKMARSKLITYDNLIQFLTQTTNTLLSEVNTVELFKGGKINDIPVGGINLNN